MPAESDSTSVLGDIGSTFTKLAHVSAEGKPLARVKLPTAHQDIARGVADAHASLVGSARGNLASGQLRLCSSAGGGLRIVVIGLERELTVEAAIRTSATAGGRIVGVYTGSDLGHGTAETFRQGSPDVALLTGGTDGGDAHGIARGAELLGRFAPGLPVVVAGNIEARDDVRRLLGNGRPIRFVPNVMPRVGELEVEHARGALREMFVEHVMGHGRFVAASDVQDAIRMPTPAAVLAAAQAVAELSDRCPAFSAPVVVDVGGATTDVHSVIPVPDGSEGYASSGIPDQVVTRTVEGDLGVREGAESLVESAAAEGYLERSERQGLLAAAETRVRAIAQIPSGPDQQRIDERLGGLAVAMALHRHAGTIATSLQPEGAVLRRTGRDLRNATCLVLTGGLFEHSARAGELGVEALRQVLGRGGLVPPPNLPVYRDRAYLLWAAGLLREVRPGAAHELAHAALEEVHRP